MLDYQLEIVGEEFVTSIGHSDEFYVNILFDRNIYRPMCTHMGEILIPNTCKRIDNHFCVNPVLLDSRSYISNMRQSEFRQQIAPLLRDSLPTNVTK